MRLCCPRCGDERFVTMLQIQLSSTGQISMFPFAASYLNQPEEREKPALICGTCDLRLSYIDLIDISNGDFTKSVDPKKDWLCKLKEKENKEKVKASG